MGITFIILEDDLACRRILAQIIEDENLGEVVAELSDGHGNVTGTIAYHQPDILLIDLLMPGKDGIEIVEELVDRGFRGRIVMISQVEKKEMVAQAYAAGIEFYINKPINRIEVISVIKSVVERLEMERSFEQMRDSIAVLDRISSAQKSTGRETPVQCDQDSFKENTREVLADLGLIGEPGSHDMMQIMLFLNSVADTERYLGDFRRLKDLYQSVQKIYLQKEEKQTEVRSIEQRVRRAVKHAMDHIAALGLEDYSDPVFERYGPKFFDFNELRVRMKELELEHDKPTKTRVNIKQFINALYWEIKR